MTQVEKFSKQRFSNNSQRNKTTEIKRNLTILPKNLNKNLSINSHELLIFSKIKEIIIITRKIISITTIKSVNSVDDEITRKGIVTTTRNRHKIRKTVSERSKLFKSKIQTVASHSWAELECHLITKIIQQIS